MKFQPAKFKVAIPVTAGLFVLVLIFALILRSSLRSPHALDPADYTESVPDGFVYECAVSVDGDELILQGFACVRDEKVSDIDCYAVLYDAGAESYLRLATQMVASEQYRNAAGDGLNQMFSGFYAFVDTNRLTQSAYELCFAYRSGEHNALIHTGQTVEVVS